MIRAFRSSRTGRIALSGLLLVALLAGTFMLGTWSSRRSRAADEQKSTNREVSQKVWATSKEILDRFPAAKHEEFMAKAIANSRKAGVEKRTGGAFGAVIVNREGVIVGEGSNHVVANNDPTWHGEVDAVRNACGKLKVLKLDGCILYTSAEPCPMCLATAYWAGVDGIVFGANYTDAKKYGGFDDAFIYEQMLKPVKERGIPQIQMSREAAVKVWKEYHALPGNTQY